MKKLVKFNRTNDINGNAVIKAFYSDNTTEIIRGGAVADGLTISALYMRELKRVNSIPYHRETSP